MFKKKEKGAPTEGAKKGKKKIGRIIAIAAVVVIVGVVIAVRSARPKELGTPVYVAEVLKGDITETVDISGTVDSEVVKTYFAQVSAPVSLADIAVGGMVKKGDLLLTYDTTDLENMLHQTELETEISKAGADAGIVGIDHAQQKAAQAAKDYDEAVKYVQHYTDCVSRAQAQLNEAQTLSEKQAALVKDIAELTKKLEQKPNSEKLAGKLAEKQKEQKQVEKELKNYNVKEIQSALELCNADLAEYKAQRDQYEAQKETDPSAPLQKKQQSLSKEMADFSKQLSQEKLDKANKGVVAEFDGIVEMLAVVDGQTSMEGAELFSVKDISRVKVNVSISKYDIAKVKVGQKAAVTINDREYEGEVSKISKVATTNEMGGTVVAAEIKVLHPDDAIVLGVEGKVKIETAQENDTLLIPSSCVNYATEGVFCYTVVDDKVKRTLIETGVADDEYTQVLSGLKEGDKVIKDLSKELEDDAPVTILDENADKGAGGAKEVKVLF